MDEAEIVVDVEATQLSKSIQRKLDTLWGEPNETENFTIFRAPRHIHQCKNNFFNPSVISIGPFHHGQASLRAMEEKKWLFLRDFLSCGDHISLDICIAEMKLLEERTRRCYSEMVYHKSNRFVEMMLLDGCFVLQYFLNNESRLQSIFGWKSQFILNDLLLLENQIPFFVVEKLFKIGIKQNNITDFVHTIIGTIDSGPTGHPLIRKPPVQIHHLAHLYHHCSFAIPDGSFPCLASQSFSMAFPNSTGGLSEFVIPCATELQDAGIKFIPKSNPRHMLDISFDQGVMEIPRQLISGDTKPRLVNLVALEQCELPETEMLTSLTSFAIFMDSLINTQKDAMILQQCGIIQNYLSSEEELTNFFNQVGDGTVLRTHFLAELFTKVNKYCESCWNRQRAKMVRDYFSSPWAAISLVAALVLLVLTCVQSFFAVYAYYVPPS
ncbi:hypothetical protein FCM35_KLT09254 [Carex littledalei]|uniref:Uncharacterized protein n=1 Tax=Carex littledalei TaxID=544730 RepID=A0A833VJR2_9POAL|nr:hypothetical protein FCM35_KLT09254 [Carex littledalei]